MLLTVFAAAYVLAGANRVYNAAQWLASGLMGEPVSDLLRSGAQALVAAAVAGVVALLLAWSASRSARAARARSVR